MISKSDLATRALFSAVAACIICIIVVTTFYLSFDRRQIQTVREVTYRVRSERFQSCTSPAYWQEQGFEVYQSSEGYILRKAKTPK